MNVLLLKTTGKPILDVVSLDRGRRLMFRVFEKDWLTQPNTFVMKAEPTSQPKSKGYSWDIGQVRGTDRAYALSVAPEREGLTLISMRWNRMFGLTIREHGPVGNLGKHNAGYCAFNDGNDVGAKSCDSPAWFSMSRDMKTAASVGVLSDFFQLFKRKGNRWEVEMTMEPPGRVSGLAFDPDGRRFVLTQWDGRSIVYDLTKDRVERGFVPTGDKPHNPLWLDEGNFVYLAGTRVYLIETGREPRLLYNTDNDESDALVDAAAWNHHLLVVTKGRALVVVDAVQGGEVCRTKLPSTPRCVQVTPPWISVGMEDGSILLIPSEAPPSFVGELGVLNPNQ